MRLLLPTLLLLAGCSGGHSTLNPSGIQASRIGNLWWCYLGVCAIVYLLVLIFMLLPLRRKGRFPVETDPPVLAPEPKKNRQLVVVVCTATGITVIILLGLALGDFLTHRALGELSSHTNPVAIKLTGHQWWWKVEYEDSIPSNIVTTANEIRVPVGRPVKMELRSADVIHSFWVPALHGKKDLVTGVPSTITFQADREGTYYGQCAEFCGHQHANMKLIVVAETEEKFQQWLQKQRQPAPPPSSEIQKEGQNVFMSMTCVMCHTIGGTEAAGTVGPNLTHLKSRQRIAANTLPNTRANLAAWINNPQHFKPGARMPPHNFSSEELNALLDYLESLQ